MKKVFKWIGIAVLTPILLFIILAVLLYLPPVQNWAVKKVTAIASEKTGMEITVGHVNLEWPLDLGIDDFRVIKANDSLPQIKDTIADIRKLVVDVQLLPLLDKRVVINEFSMNHAKLNTNGFISDLRIKGELEELWLSSKGIDLEGETVEVNGGRLSNAQLDIALSDTAAVDTTQSETKWKINADSLSIYRSAITLHLPGDTLNVDAYLGQVVAREADIDLGTGIYRVASFDWHDGRLSYDNRLEPETQGLDYNHIALEGIRLGVDSISYSPSGTSLYIRQTAAKERSGLEITDLRGGLKLDSTMNHIEIPAMILKTPDSDMAAEIDMDFNAFDEQNPGNMRLRLNAQLGKQDLMRFVGDMPQKFIQRYPNYPISIKGSLNGNIQQMEFTGLDISLPTAFHLTANGTAGNVTDLNKLKADVRLNAKTQDLGFLTAMLDPKVMSDYRIPNGISLEGTLKTNGPKYTANLTAREGSGTIRLDGTATIPQNNRGEMNLDAISYDANIKVSNINVHHFMPKDSIYTVTATIKAKGYGTDFLSNRSHLTADATISHLQYGQWNLKDLTAIADLRNGRGQATVTGHNELLNGNIGIDALLSTKKLEATISADIARADLFRLRLVNDTLTVGLCGHIDVTSDMKQTHYVSGFISDLFIQDEKGLYHPDDIGILIKTSPDTTCLRAQSGDFIIKLDGSSGYERLISQSTALMDSVMAQYEQKIIDQPAIKRLLPTVKLHVESKRNNPIANLLRTSDIEFKELMMDLTTSPETGINGSSYLYSLNYDSIRIDTIRLNLTQKGDRMTYQAQVRNNKRNPQFVFNALVDGHFHEHGALAGLRYFDDKDRLGVRIGATAEMENGGIRFRLMPERPTLGYKEFNLNKDNFVFMGSDKKIQAKIDLIADDNTGLKLYTENQDSTMLQDLTLSLHRIDLGEITSVIPYLPRITGKLNGDYHILQDKNEHISVASDMAVQNMTYEGSPIGNISSELVYLMKEDNTHAVEARLMLDEEEFGLLSGTFHSPKEKNGESSIDAIFTMTRLPLSLANGFVPDQIIGLDGYGEGSLTIKGTTTHPKVDGEVYLDSAYLVSIPYGVRMRFDNDPVRIVGSHLLLENFGLYAYNDEPLNLMGNIDFSDTDRIMVDLRMQARNLQIINAKQEAKSIAFGKAYVNFFARLRGPLEELNMRGRLDVLGSTDMTYMLLDSPLSTDNRLEELVKFTDFSDTTQVVVTRPMPSGLNVDLNINVSEGTHIVCNLNADQTNYVDLMGGGDLRMKYNSEGINMTGRYTMTEGQMKYSLPIIPLKTFTIKEGSYVEFNGDPMNPKLNITATERIKASVDSDAGGSRSVAFDCGVVITQTLNNMGLEFIIEAPESNDISGDLATMSKEERGKVAVAMLTTGMYLTSSNQNFSMNSALSSFLQGEINQLTGAALKTIDVSVGIDNTTDASGTTHTDYSFKFAKRFMNNRLKVELGGKVASGANTDMGEKQSFFDNVTMEYRLNQNATQNVKIFYRQNVYDWLEGYTSMYGIGFVWRRKLQNFWDIFTFWKKEPQPTIPMRQPGSMQSSGTPMLRDSVETDSVRVKK